MQVNEIKLHKINKLLADYKTGAESMKEKFDYEPFEEMSYIKRAEELGGRIFKRKELAELLAPMNRKWGGTESTIENINRLKDEKSMVVIGGQQAGLLTGPLYTIHKIITLIQVAKKQEKALKVPVIPVFWIAGEDHDFEEINHIFLAEADRMKKHTINQYQYEKKSVSSISLDRAAAMAWLENIFREMEETAYTIELFQKLKEALIHSDTYVDFFARLIFHLFKESGIVLVDSGDASLRRLESEYFEKLILKQPEISKGVYSEIQKNMQQGYPGILDIQKDDGHLFYHLNQERILLTRENDGSWTGKQGLVHFSEKEFLELAEQQPENLSNNVVTRPVMQELLFPSLAFVGGPGEVAYWSVLKPAFKAVNCNMPIVLPRMSFSFIDRKAAKQMEAFSLDPELAVNFGIAREKGNWLNSQLSPPLETMAEEVKKAVDNAHLPLREAAQTMRSDLGNLAEKNLLYLFQDIDFLKDRLVNELKMRHSEKLASFDRLQLLLYPMTGLQERSWNIIPWLNQYGEDFLLDLINEDFNPEADHYLIYL